MWLNDKPKPGFHSLWPFCASRAKSSERMSVHGLVTPTLSVKLLDVYLCTKFDGGIGAICARAFIARKEDAKRVTNKGLQKLCIVVDLWLIVGSEFRIHGTFVVRRHHNKKINAT